MPDRERGDINGAQLIVDERRRQIAGENYEPSHDDAHGNGELLDAALAYALSAQDSELYTVKNPPSVWPFGDSFKPTTPIRDLIKAGALIAAELDRLLRLENK